MANKNPELEFKRDEFVKDLLTNPIENDNFTATFHKNSPHSGEVIFQDKNFDRTAKALWGVFIENGELMASLANYGEPPLPYITIENYREFINQEIEVLNLFTDRNKK